MSCFYINTLLSRKVTIFAYSLGFYSNYAVRGPRFTPQCDGFIRSPYFVVHIYKDVKGIRKTGEDNDFKKTIFVHVTWLRK